MWNSKICKRHRHFGGAHHKDAEWLKDAENELEQNEGQDKIDLTKDKMMRVLRKIPNLKAPGQCPRLLVKEFDSITWQITDAFSELSRLWDGPDWLKIGRTVLMQKDIAKGNIASNYQPITCLPLILNLLKGILVERSMNI